jgi:ankyrin repeat protein
LADNPAAYLLESCLSSKQGATAKDFRDKLLYVAAQNGYSIAAEVLLTAGADVSAKDDYGRTPLSWAAQNGHEAVVKLLLETGRVDADLKNEYCQTPLSRAAQNGHEAIVKLLRNYII